MTDGDTVGGCKALLPDMVEVRLDPQATVWSDHNVQPAPGDNRQGLLQPGCPNLQEGCRVTRWNVG
jgi:hypothetical protein